jgi:ABC-type nickel/cobalt efflux system permease component RcnA
MKPNMKACGQAMVTAMVNAVLALALMLLVEFAISGTFQIAEPYLWAGSLIWLVIFVAQFWRQRHLCRSDDQREVKGGHEMTDLP